MWGLSVAHDLTQLCGSSAGCARHEWVLVFSLYFQSISIQTGFQTWPETSAAVFFLRVPVYASGGSRHVEMSPSVKLVQSFFFFFYLVLINRSTSAHNRYPWMDWKSGATITDPGFICSNKNFTPTPHPHPPPLLMDQRVLLHGLDSVPASVCAVRFRKSDLAPCYLLETSNVHGLNTRSKLRSSKLHCAALWWSSSKSDSRFAWWSRATPLARKSKPIFFWISLPILHVFYYININNL